MLNGMDAAMLVHFVSCELKANFRKIRRVVKLDAKTTKGVKLNLRNLEFLYTSLAVYGNKINICGAEYAHVATQVSPRKEKDEASVCYDIGVQTEETLDSVGIKDQRDVASQTEAQVVVDVAREQRCDVGTQTEVFTDTKMIKRKEISPNGDSQISKKKPRQSVGSYIEASSKGDNVSANKRGRGRTSKGGFGNGSTSEVDGATRGDVT